jgi:hypothetical protein
MDGFGSRPGSLRPSMDPKISQLPRLPSWQMYETLRFAAKPQDWPNCCFVSISEVHTTQSHQLYHLLVHPRSISETVPGVGQTAPDPAVSTNMDVALSENNRRSMPSLMVCHRSPHRHWNHQVTIIKLDATLHIFGQSHVNFFVFHNDISQKSPWSPLVLPSSKLT